MQLGVSCDLLAEQESSASALMTTAGELHTYVATLLSKQQQQQKQVRQ